MKLPITKRYYYVTLFKIEGHETWRVHTGSNPDDLDSQLKGGNTVPKVTERKVQKIDRLTGEIEMM